MKVYQEFERRLEERYRKLYGGKACGKKIEKVRRNLLIKCSVLVLVICAAAAFDLLTGTENTSNL